MRETSGMSECNFHRPLGLIRIAQHPKGKCSDPTTGHPGVLAAITDQAHAVVLRVVVAQGSLAVVVRLDRATLPPGDVREHSVSHREDEPVASLLRQLQE